MSKKKKASKKHDYKLLKMIGRPIYRFFESIFKLIDKIIVTPISKLILKVSKASNFTSRPIDRLLNNKSFLIVFSLILAFVAFVVIGNTTNTSINSSADIIYNQKINVLYNEQDYVVEGLPNTVDITMIGRRSDLYLAKQYPNDEIVADLRGLKPGSHEIKLKYNGSVSSVTYKLDPSTVTVVIYEKLSESRKVKEEVLFENKLDSKYTISDISFSMDDVYIKGAKYKLEKVANVKALINCKDIVINSDTLNATGSVTTTLKDVPLYAYDEENNPVDVEIVPGKIDATLVISSPSKEVPLRVEFEVSKDKEITSFGKAIENVTLSTNKVTIYGNKEDLEKISYIPVKLDVTNVSKDTEFNVNISKPSGVKEMSASSVVVKVTFGDVIEKTIENVAIQTKNLPSGYKAQAATKNDSVVTVKVKGTENNLKNISKDNIEAYVDLKDITALGEYSVKVLVKGEDNKATYTSQTNKVKIIVSKS